MRWAGLAALALVGGLLSPVIVAPTAQAATITRADADCTTGTINTGAPISGAPGDVVDITANLTSCNQLTVDSRLVDDSTALSATATAGGTVTITTLGSGDFRADTNTSFASVQVTLGSTPASSNGGISIVDTSVPIETSWNVTISGSPPTVVVVSGTTSNPTFSPSSADVPVGQSLTLRTSEANVIYIVYPRSGAVSLSGGGAACNIQAQNCLLSDSADLVLTVDAQGEIGIGGGRFLIGTAPAPNPPTPATPPSAPASAEATAGNGEATVSWTAPASQGSFPVTNYQVQSTPSSKGCLVPVTATTCRIAGLRNGTAYTFQVRALNGGGWGSWATTETVVPRPEPDPEASIMITGSRSANDRVARVTGQTTGLTGATLQSMVRLSTQTEFAAGSVRTVNAQGEFAWQRRAAATVSVQVYFTAGALSSNTVTIAGS
jgi:large repetitive protein